MNCDSIRTDLNAYLDGELPKNLRESVAAHLESCEHCRKELEQLKRTVALVKSLAPLPTMPGLETRIMQRWITSRSLQPRWSGFPFRQFSAAMLVFLLVLGIYQIQRRFDSTGSPPLQEMTGKGEVPATDLVIADRVQQSTQKQAAAQEQLDDVARQVPARPETSRSPSFEDASPARSVHPATKQEKAQPARSQESLALQPGLLTGSMDETKAKKPAVEPRPADSDLATSAQLRQAVIELDSSGAAVTIRLPGSEDPGLPSLILKALEDSGVVPVPVAEPDRYLLVSFRFDVYNQRVMLVGTQVLKDAPF